MHQVEDADHDVLWWPCKQGTAKFALWCKLEKTLSAAGTLISIKFNISTTPMAKIK